ncbi:maltokinase N-terminal cap-like domain-containing protein [Streptosporangium roseum]|uniref:maltokinase N-terminal cap-like domain-containing protein n=1 Tax=Streptosporangium roseum TaxID=2001 RepID=UPI00331B120A
MPGRDRYTGPAGEVPRVAAFRFDDPAGAVGIETMLVPTGDGPVHRVPLTYRDAPWPVATIGDSHAVLSCPVRSGPGAEYARLPAP